MTDHANTITKVTQLIANKAGVDALQVTPETRLIQDLAFDSLDVMETVMEIEEQFGVQVPDEDLKELESVRHISEYVLKRQSAAAL